MKRSWLFAAALACAIPLPASASPESDFAALLARARGGDAGVDMLALRQGNAASFHYFIPRWEDERAAFDALKKTPDEALKKAEARLAVNYLDLFAHIAAEQALKSLGRQPEADQHHAFILAIIHSVGGGNDGSSSTASWNASSVDEEYAVLALAGLKPAGQGLIQQDGHTYDVMTVNDADTGKQTKIWFEIDSFFGKEFQ